MDENEQYLEDLRAYNIWVRETTRKAGIMFPPVPPAPKIGSPTYQHDVDAFLDCLPGFVQGINAACVRLETTDGR